MTSILGTSLLEKSDFTAFAQRLFSRDQTTGTAATDSSSLLTNVDRSTNDESTPFQNFIADLNASRSQQYGETYNATGTATRSTANTVLIGYG